MKIGFIIGRDDEIYEDEWLYSVTPKKYLVDGNLNVDVAIAMTVSIMYPTIKVDIIKPEELSIARLKRNYVNFPLGYDIINANIGSPYIQKFSTKKGYQNLMNIYRSKESRIFPPYEHLEFIWNKDKYMKYYDSIVPINPTIYITDKISVESIIDDIHKKGWKQFIIKPIGATTADGFKKFSNKKMQATLPSYFSQNSNYSKFLIQELVKGFETYGEVRMYWIDCKYSYSVNTTDKGFDYIVKPVTNKKIIDVCENLGKKVIDNLPPIIINKQKINPVMIRTDFACCLGNQPKKSLKYYLNEIEYQDAGTFVNFDTIQYPIVTVLADVFVKKARELESIKF